MRAIPQGLSSSAATRLDEFWFSEVDLAPLGLFRIIFGIELLNWFWQLLPNLGAFFTEDRMLPGATLRPLRSDASMMSRPGEAGRQPGTATLSILHLSHSYARPWAEALASNPMLVRLSTWGTLRSQRKRWPPSSVVPALVTTSELQRRPDIDASSCA